MNTNTPQIEGILQVLLSDKCVIANDATILLHYIYWDSQELYHNADKSEWSNSKRVGFYGETSFNFETLIQTGYEKKHENMLILASELTQPLETPTIIIISKEIGVKVTWKFTKQSLKYKNKLFKTSLRGVLNGTLFIK